MKQIFTILLFLGIAAFAQANNPMELQGTCSGNLIDGAPVSFTYFSDFDGCQEISNAAINFKKVSQKGVFKGKRTFLNSEDIYTFKVKKNGAYQEAYRVTFNDATQNTAGLLGYRDLDGKMQSITVQCQVRDYEYGECE